ncbi:hypothetical protein EVAR_43497_1 [Eumeta japonica]|uniref:Uncharacterized protein n=1 Tax=Eumeta variegata TaxID=151549 RepID=A0A4C1YGU1_EUMVA|nr:hypothetical protein EVAR_43497_1 [Eumeta japonica]
MSTISTLRLDRLENQRSWYWISGCSVETATRPVSSRYESFRVRPVAGAGAAPAAAHVAPAYPHVPREHHISNAKAFIDIGYNVKPRQWVARGRLFVCARARRAGVCPRRYLRGTKTVTENLPRFLLLLELPGSIDECCMTIKPERVAIGAALSTELANKILDLTNLKNVKVNFARPHLQSVLRR